ncbi:MAG: TIGR04211 family SH3 domain-containing protein [Kangiellaceae bacterium]|jgi:SH3 domain protein|nr:TIGR04211 family SH3 domain-containing protein [Kangiellaceae bacterium]
MLTRFTLILLISFLTLSANAERTAYVTDNIGSAVRSGTSIEYRILFNINAGSTITVLDDAEENGYVKIRDSRGREGWTLARFITDRKSSRVRLSEVSTALAQANKTITQLKAQHQKELSQLTQQLEQANMIVEKSKYFQEQISELETNNATLSQQNRLASDRYVREQFFYGAAVIVVGIIFGMFISRGGKNKRSGWS